jgi:hypothetical protein
MMRPTEFPARGFPKDTLLFFEPSFFDMIDTHHDDGGVLARVLPFPHDLPVVVFSHGTAVSGARTDVVAGSSLLLLVTGEFVVLVPWYWILKLIGNWSSWKRDALFVPSAVGRPRIENLKSRHRR